MTVSFPIYKREKPPVLGAGLEAAKASLHAPGTSWNPDVFVYWVPKTNMDYSPYPLHSGTHSSPATPFYLLIIKYAITSWVSISAQLYSS